LWRLILLIKIINKNKKKIKFISIKINIDHSVSQPIPMQRRPGSFPGNENACGLLSPKSAENLGLRLVNYILDDNSPSVKELENRLKNVKIAYVT
jgi:hypothetical protein